MEKTVNQFRATFYFALCIIALTTGGCNSATNEISPSPERSNQSSEQEIGKSNLLDKNQKFINKLNDLKGKLQQLDFVNPESVDFTEIVEAYESINDQESSIDSGDKKIFEALQSIKDLKIDTKIDTSSEEIKTLQNVLIEETRTSDIKPEDPPIYGKQTNQALIKYFESLAARLEPQSSVNETNTANSGGKDVSNSNTILKKSKMPIDWISLFFDLFAIGLIGVLTFRLWKLSQQVEILNKSLNSKVSKLDQRLQHKETKINDVLQSFQYLDQRVSAQDQKVSSFEHSVRQQKPSEYKHQTYSSSSSSPYPDLREDQSQYAQIYSRQTVPEPLTASVELAQRYNQSPNALAQLAIGVSQTQNSLNLNLRDSSNSSVFLARDPSPNYWIIQDQHGNFWLFPRDGWEPSIGTIESFGRLFKSIGEVSRHFHVIKPASVIVTSQNEWELQEKGEVEFR